METGREDALRKAFTLMPNKLYEGYKMKRLPPSLVILILLSTGSFAQEPIEIFDKPTGLVDIWDDKPERSDMVPKYPVDIKDIPGEPKKPIELWPAKKSCAETAIDHLVGNYKIRNGPATMTISIMGRTKTIKADAAIASSTASLKKRGKKLKLVSKVFGDMHLNFVVSKCKKDGTVHLQGRGKTTLGDVGTVPISMQLVASRTGISISGSMKWNPASSSTVTTKILMLKSR